MSQRYYQTRFDNRTVRTYQHSPGGDTGQIKRRLKRPVLACVVLFIGIIIGSSILRAHTTKATTNSVHYSKTQTVCLDPGHGGIDPGATTSDGTITERDINLVVALRVRQIVQNDGYRVYMTRTTNDVSLSNRDRYTYCNNQHATIMVSMHHNFFSDTSVDYTTTLFYKDEDQALAASVLAGVTAKLGTANDGISQFQDGVLSESLMPATLCEGFFMTDSDEAALLAVKNSPRLSDEAVGIANGIVSYFTTPKKMQPAINPNPQVIERDD